PWWWIALPLALVAAGIFYVSQRKSVPVAVADPVVEVVPEPLPPPPPPPAPELPRHTIALRPYQDDNDLPIVAWIVPLTGLASSQPFRLAARTVIGAGVDCDVRIDDPHMSRHHAEILFLDGDYVLVDRDSRNGVSFYDKPVKRHTLIDNDLFTCGTTSFKF